MKLTDRNIQSIKANGKTRWITDDKITGFCVRIHLSGKVTYCLWYSRPDGRRLRHKIADGISAEAARKLATKLKGEFAQGIYPNSKKKDGYTIGTMLERYLKNHLGADHQAKRFIKPLIADLRDAQPEYFTPKEAVVFFDELEASPATKTITIKSLSASWNYAFARGHVSVPNPCGAVRKIIKHTHQKRAKAIEPEQYQQLFVGLREMRDEGT